MKKGFGILWVLSLSLAFLAGYKVSLTEQPLLLNQKQTNYQTEQLTTKSEKTTVALSNEVVTMQKIVQKNVKIKDVLFELKSLKLNTSFGRSMATLAQSYNLIKDLSENELYDLLVLLKGDSHNDDYLQMIIEKYAELNPENAIAFVGGNLELNSSKARAMHAIFSAWSKTDPESAYYWLLDNDGKAPLEYYLSIKGVGVVPVFNGLADKNVKDAINKLADISKQDISNAIAGIVSTLTTEDDYIAFIEAPYEFNESKLREGALTRWINTSPKEAVQWLGSVKDISKIERLKNIAFIHWSYDQPQEAAYWYFGTAKEQDKQSYANQIVKSWSYSDPQLALDWLGQQTGIDIQKTTKSILESSSYNQIEFTINNLALLSNEKDRQSVSFGIYKRLKYKNRQEAIDFLEQSPYKDEIEQSIKLSKQAKNSGLCY